MIYHDDFSYDVKGLFGFHKIENAKISCKLIEECCINDYLSIEKKYPDWSIQEQGKDWPDQIKENHLKITEKSLNSNSKRKKINL